MSFQRSQARWAPSHSSCLWECHHGDRGCSVVPLWHLLGAFSPSPRGLVSSNQFSHSCCWYSLDFANYEESRCSASLPALLVLWALGSSLISWSHTWCLFSLVSLPGPGLQNPQLLLDSPWDQILIRTCTIHESMLKMLHVKLPKGITVDR